MDVRHFRGEIESFSYRITPVFIDFSSEHCRESLAYRDIGEQMPEVLSESNRTDT
jgi:hypothetical protein